MKSGHLLLAALTCAQTLAQSSDLLSILASEAYSVFTSFTAVQPTGTTTASTASTSASSSASPTLAALSSISSTTPSSTLSTSNTASSNASVTSQTDSAAAASTTAAAVSTSSSSSSSNHNRTIAIVLGTVLGALALGLLILVLLLLRRRRRHRHGPVRSGYISPSSDSIFEGHKTATSRVAPVERPNTPKQPESLHSRSHVRAPLMSEHANHDMPFPHAFQNSSSTPFIPGTDDARRSLNSSTSGHPGTWFDAADGLSSHPVYRHDLNGSQMGAALGGAAVGAAAVAAQRRSKHRGNREAAKPLERSGPHPQYLDGPYPLRSPRRASTESAKRRSGSTSRSLEQSQLQSPTFGQEIVKPLSGTNHGPHEMSAMPTPPVAKGNINPLDETAATHEYGNPVNVASTKTRNSPNPQSRSRSYPPLPPALTIPQANRVQPPRIPSRSPKRARFADKDTYHEPTTYEDAHSVKSSNISTPTQPSPWTPRSQTMSASTINTDGLVSPISPEDTTRRIDHGVSLAPARANLVDIPRSRDPSPNPPPQSSARTSDPFTDETSKHHSGLVDAVQTHFTPNPPQPQRPQQLYTLFPIGPEHGRNTDARNSRALTRKPVPTSTYNAANPAKENWWRGSGAHDVHLNDRQHEDSAWANNYGSAPQ